MSAFASGDTLTPSTLNRRLSSAVSTGGFSVNTVQPESGATLYVLASGGLSVGSGNIPGAYPALAIAGTYSGSGRDLLSIGGQMDGAGNPRGISNYPAFAASANSQLLVALASGASIGLGGFSGLTYYGIESFGPNSTGAGTLALAVGVQVDDHTIATTNYAVYTGKGQNRFGDTSRFTDGSAVAPSLAMDSEVSLGFFRSAASTLKMSYGTLQLSGMAVVGINSSISLVPVASAPEIQSTGGLYFKANNAYALAIDTNFNVGVGTASFTPGTGAGGVLFLANTSPPSGSPSQGGVLFCRGGALLFKGTSGSLTTIAVP